ncbi:uncharacterized protein J4E79_010777 [Alternaria viburni]|uniref:uncharacterized protein n=1 Tax=Alternaria viburni TaxID=566460 RepID=UPI0020C36685|nr:uncharacterized protein J4E79_010777 [Alternaria viburni]KAI4645599.1 hypothetical protein J4E79_010777 [Alternaria viburni]
MTKYPKRLIERTLNAMQTPKVCTLGRMRRRLHCSIDGQNAEALPDSGSDVDIMSLDYMLNRGFICEASDEQVIFADGRRKSVHGICVVQLSIGKDGRVVDNRPAVEMNTQRQEHSPRTSSPSSPSSLSSSSSSDAGLKFLEGGPVRHVIESRFYVLEGIDVDVLVGASSLESLKAFSHHQDAFFSPELESQSPALHRISLAERARKLARKLTVVEDSGRSNEARPTAQEQLSQADQRENAQRESADAISAKLSGEEKVEFDNKEEARRKAYDDYRAQLLNRPSGSP